MFNAIMSNFSFDSLAETSFTSASQNYLKPYDIYKVNLTSITNGELQGKKDPNAKYNIVTLEFASPEGKGIFTENLFVPSSDSDFERRENPTSHKLMPSRFDQFQFTLMQIVEAINPKGAQAIKAAASKLKTMDDFIKVIIKALQGKNSVEVYLKLVGQESDGRTYARLPNACLIGTDGRPSALNFISSDESKLYFSNYEIGKMKAYKEAKPTVMPEDKEESSEEFDLDGIDL